jgi:hypothetical protein
MATATIPTSAVGSSKSAVISMGLSDLHKEVNSPPATLVLDETKKEKSVGQSDVRRSFVSTISQSPSLHSSNTPTHHPSSGSKQKSSTTLLTRGGNSLTPSSERKTPQHTPTRTTTTTPSASAVPTVSLDLSKSFRSPGKRSLR